MAAGSFDSVKFVNPVAESVLEVEEGRRGGGRGSQLEDEPQEYDGEARHVGHKLIESLTKGIDPFVKIFLGNDGHENFKRTASVVGTQSNNHGRCPVWGEADQNRLRLKPSAEDTMLTIEVWDSDVRSDDLIGGRTLLLEEVRAMCDNASTGEEVCFLDGAEPLHGVGKGGVIHLQLFADPGRSGRDGGVMQLAMRWEPGGDIEIEPQACVDLLSDTPDVRDMSTFSDWKLVKRATLVYLAYVAFLTSYCYWLFSVYACGGPETKCDVKSLAESLADSSLTTVDELLGSEGQESANETAGQATVYPANATAELGWPDGVYPALEGAGPGVDSLLFVLTISTTVGWGNQPIDLTTRYNDTNAVVEGFATSQVIRGTKILLSISVMLEIIMMGVIIGALGNSFRAFFRNRVHHATQKALEQRKLDFSKRSASRDLATTRALAQQESETQMDRHPFILSTLLLLLLAAIGTIAYSKLEKECVDPTRTSLMDRQLCFAEQSGETDEKGRRKGWKNLSVIDALYMTVISITTIGFGDYAPSTYRSKWFSVFYLPIAVAFTANAIDHIALGISNHRRKQLERYVLDQFGGKLAYSSMPVDTAEPVVGEAQNHRADGEDFTGPGLTPEDFTELQRSVDVHETIPMTRNDFRLAVRQAFHLGTWRDFC